MRAHQGLGRHARTYPALASQQLAQGPDRQRLDELDARQIAQARGLTSMGKDASALSDEEIKAARRTRPALSVGCAHQRGRGGDDHPARSRRDRWRILVGSDAT
jgi:hypothetical protein